jgi:hypothetical protein
LGVVLAIDFDGTLADHRYPDIGAEVPGAISWLKEFRAAGAKLILWTMRSDSNSEGGRLTLSEAVQWCNERGVFFYGINENPDQSAWTHSPKAYAHIYIDDAAFGCPLRRNPRWGGRPFVDWSVVGPAVMAKIVPADAAERA